MPFYQRAGLAVVSGVFLSAGFLLDALFFTAWFALVPLLLALEELEERQSAIWLGIITGFVTHLLGFYWLVETMVRFGGIPYVVSVILFVLIAGLFGLIQLLFALGYHWGNKGWRWGSLWQALFIAALYTAIEWVYPHVFPWRLGNTQIAWLPMVQIADITGVYGITFLVVLVNALLFQVIVALPGQGGVFPWRGLVVASLLLGTVVSYGYWRLNRVQNAIDQAPKFRVALLQPNIGIPEKYDPRFAEQQLEWLAQLSQQVIAQGAQLVIWPETAYRYWVPTELTHIPWPLPAPASTWFLIGANTFYEKPERRENFNSALLLSAQGQVLGRYDKRKLLVFGEYIPLESYFPFLKGISTAIGDFTPGYGDILLTIPNGPTMAPLICYEDILPSLSRESVQQGAQVLINLTNDIWFGKTRAPYQHQLLALFRAIENRVPLIRATNTGVTSVLAPTGQLVIAADIFVEATLVWDIPLLQNPPHTFYTRYGDLFALLTVFGVVGGLWHSRFWKIRSLCMLMILLLPFGCWSVPSTLWANGGTPRLTAVEAGPYLVSAWTQPHPPQVGRLHVSVAVMKPPTRDAVLDAEVQLVAEPLGQQHPPITGKATHEAGANILLYHANMELPSADTWKITIRIVGAEGHGNTDFFLQVEPASLRNWWGLGIGGIGILLVFSWFVWRRRVTVQ